MHDCYAHVVNDDHLTDKHTPTYIRCGNCLSFSVSVSKKKKKQSKKKLKQSVWMLIKPQLSRMKYCWHFVPFSAFVHSFASFSHARPGLGKTEMCLENKVWWVSKAAVILKVHESNPNQGGWAKIQSRANTTVYNQKFFHSSGAVWESRWPSWAVRSNEPSGFRGRKVILNHASALVSACP